MFGSINEVFVVAMTFSDFNLSNANSLECISIINQECKVRSETINVNTYEPLFYPYNITIKQIQKQLEYC